MLNFIISILLEKLFKLEKAKGQKCFFFFVQVQKGHWAVEVLGGRYILA